MKDLMILKLVVDQENQVCHRLYPNRYLNTKDALPAVLNKSSHYNIYPLIALLTTYITLILT